MSKSLKVVIPLFIFCLFSANIFAKDLRPYEKITTDFISTGLSSLESYNILKEFLKAAPSRQSGSAGAKVAIEWAKAKMESLGLSNVHLEPAMVTHWEKGTINSLNIVSPSVAESKLDIIASGGSVPTPKDGIMAEVVEIHSKKEIEELGDKLKGKIAFLNGPMDQIGRASCRERV